MKLSALPVETTILNTDYCICNAVISGVETSIKISWANIITALSLGGGSGVTGQGAFSVSSGTITNLSVHGIVSNVVRNSAGIFTVSFTGAQANNNYYAGITVPDDAIGPTFAYLSGTISNYTTTGFVIQVERGGTSIDPTFMRFIVV